MIHLNHIIEKLIGSGMKSLNNYVKNNPKVTFNKICLLFIFSHFFLFVVSIVRKIVYKE